MLERIYSLIFFVMCYLDALVNSALNIEMSASSGFLQNLEQELCRRFVLRIMNSVQL
jgi:hypothetical protein